MLGLGRVMLSPAHGISVSTRAVDLVAEATVIDMLSLLTLDWSRLRRWQYSPESFGEEDFRYLEASGIQIFHPAVEPRAADPRERAKQWLARWRNLLGNRPCFLTPVGSLTDLLQASRVGKLGVLVGFQSSDHFRDVDDVELFFGWGQRVSQLTYNDRNRLGSGCFAVPDTGLTPFGAEVVAAMNRLGMAVDISHCGERTSVEAIATSRKPVLVTHSNCRALVPHQRRNKSDRVIELMAAVADLPAARPRPAVAGLPDRRWAVAPRLRRCRRGADPGRQLPARPRRYLGGCALHGRARA
ncbi:MAG: dipeptidase [Thermoanaerobaculia bacterium]